MKINKLIATVLALIGAFDVIGQSKITQPPINWGAMVSGVALSITLSNDVVSAGTNVALTWRIKNTSTNLANFPMFVGGPHLYVILTNSSGAIHELTPGFGKFQRGSCMAGNIIPGHTNELEELLVFGQDIRPGTYQLIAKRGIEMGKKPYEIISNVLQIRVQ